MISLKNYNGFAISKESLPVGSLKGGKTFGASLPNPFGFFSASYRGISSKLTILLKILLLPNAYP